MSELDEELKTSEVVEEAKEEVAEKTEVKQEKKTNNETRSNDRIKGLVAYLLGFIGGLIMLLLKDNSKTVRFHGAQAIVISVGYYIISIAYSFIPVTIPLFNTVLNAIYAILIIMGCVKAYKEEEPELPVVGGIAKSIFAKQIDAE